MTFYEEIANIERIIDCIESDNRENGIMPNIEYGVMPYELELPSLLRELIELKSLTSKEGYIISKEYAPCTWCEKPTKITEPCSEKYFCSKECEDAFMDFLMKLNEERI